MRRDDDDAGSTDPRELEDQDRLRQLSRARQGRAVKLIVAVALLVILIMFIVANSKRVQISYVFFSRNTRLIWIMLACSFLGGVIGYLVGRPGRQFRFRRKDTEPGDPTAGPEKPTPDR